VSDEHHTFRGFKRVAGTAEVYKAFRDLAEGTSEYCFLLAYGGVGNGKTHLLEATALRLAERGIRSTVWVVPDFVSYLRRLINPEWPGRLDGVLERYQASSGAVLFDDFCLEYGTAWEESIMERIICGRYRNKGITVITTNKDLDTMPERIVSRFFEPGVGKVVLNEGKDFRRRGTRL
jgi:DNA replication protein DnaC